MNWEIILVPEVHDWYMTLDDISASLVWDSIELLAERAPPWVAPRRIVSPDPSCTTLKNCDPAPRGGPRSGS